MINGLIPWDTLDPFKQFYFNNLSGNRLKLYIYSETPCDYTMYSSQNPTEDSQLWKDIISGDRKALAQIYDRYVKVLYNYGNKICQNKTIVQDAIHDVFVDIWRYHKNLSPADSVRFYLYVSLRRKILKQLQEIPHYHGVDFDELHLAIPSRETNLIESEAKDEQLMKLKINLNNLSPRQYEAIVLKFYDNLSYPEIAKLMEMNEQSVRNLIQRGLEQLKKFSKLVVSMLLFSLFTI
jgi:RNA polymerase sigma factor (sigma-70 family)